MQSKGWARKSKAMQWRENTRGAREGARWRQGKARRGKSEGHSKERQGEGRQGQAREWHRKGKSIQAGNRKREGKEGGKGGAKLGKESKG